MIRPDIEEVREFMHSAKGSTWDKHKYVKRVDGMYYYPDGYEGGRTMESFRKDLRNKRFTSKDVNQQTSGKTTSSTKKTTPTARSVSKRLVSFGENGTDEGKSKKLDPKKKNLSSAEVQKLTNAVIRGDYGNGAERKKALGANYQQIQNEVNKKLKQRQGSPSGNTVKTSVNSSSATQNKKAKTQKKKTTKQKESAKSTTSQKKELDLSSIYSVYQKRKRG